MSTLFEKEFAAVQPQRRKPPPNKDFSTRFVSALEKAGVSQGELAKRLGLDKTTVWRWTEGLTQPTASLWPQIAEELGVSVPFLFGQAEARPSGPSRAERERDALKADYARLQRDYDHLRSVLEAALASSAGPKHQP